MNSTLNEIQATGPQVPSVRPRATKVTAQRVQTGVRMEKRLLKVLKALAEYLDLTLGDLLEGIVLHSFEGKPPFGDATLRRIEQLKDVYGLELDLSASQRLMEAEQRKRLRTENGRPFFSSAEQTR